MYITYYIPDKGIKNESFFTFLTSSSTETARREKGRWETLRIENAADNIPERQKKQWTARALNLARVSRKIQASYPAKERFHAYHIPKKSGGYRLIEEPIESVMNCLRQAKDFLEKEMKFHPHPSAFAYVENTGTLDALKKHQEAENKWFLKLDFHNFFGSTTKNLLMEKLWNLYPFCLMKNEIVFKASMEEIFCLAFAADGHLPQGTPLSPLITNICMLDSDFYLDAYCENHGIVYTRYADDLLFSAKTKEALLTVKGIVKHTIPQNYKLNNKKTRLGSIAGSNWNLGLMLNKDNNITVGKKKKDVMRASLFNLTQKINAKEGVTKEEENRLVGLYNYYHHIEPEYFNTITERICKKTGVNLYEHFGLNR